MKLVRSHSVNEPIPASRYMRSKTNSKLSSESHEFFLGRQALFPNLNIEIQLLSSVYRTLPSPLSTDFEGKCPDRDEVDICAAGLRFNIPESSRFGSW